MDNNCLFCRIVAGEIPATVVHETDTTLAFRDIDPKAPVHVLVIPKEHHPDVVTLAQNDPAGSADLLAACAAVAEGEGLLMEGFRLLFNTGGYAGQEVFHVHAHVLGGEPLGPMLAPKGPGFSAPSEGPGAGSGGAPKGPGFSAPSEGPGAGSGRAPR